MELSVDYEKFNIPQSVLTVLDLLEAGGCEAWLVGGCVRDRLRGCVPKDYDIATSAGTQRVAGIFRDFRVVETGVKHGTVTVISDGMPIEVTTYRVDGSYSDGRHPDSVSFSSDIREDLSRRDFTVNAIAYSPVRGYLDLFGGADDLRKGIIRCVGEPDRRFHEDALRILRAMRFASVLGFAIEPETAASIHRSADMLSLIAVERITQELFGILCGAHAGDILRSFGDVLARVMPPVKRLFGFRQQNPHHDFDVWEHTLRVIDASPPDRVLRLAALLHDIGKPDCFSVGPDGVGHFYGHPERSAEIAREIFSRYIRTDRRTEERALLLVERHNDRILPDRKLLRKRLSKYGEEAMRQMMALDRADVTGQKEVPDAGILAGLDEAEAVLDELVRESACLTLKELMIGGDDLISMGVPKGPMIGRILGRLLAEVIDETLPNTRGALTRRAGELRAEYCESTTPSF